MKRNKFSLSNQHNFTGDMGYIYPITWQEVLPLDTWQIQTTALVRLRDVLAPVMNPCHVKIHYWFIPNRLIWDDWEDFITGGDDGNDTTEHPYRAWSSVTESQLKDYLGLPVGTWGDTINVNVLPFRALALVYNEWYRDQDLCTELTVSKGNGSDTTTNINLIKAPWGKDYLTCCRPTEQKGDDVLVTIAGEAKVTGLGKTNQTFGTGGNVYETDGSGTVAYASMSQVDGAAGNNQWNAEEDPSNAGYPNIRADLTTATGMSINDLRDALAEQRYKEARSMFGSRYVEYLRYMGVKNPSDARLQNPEYIGGGRSVISFSEVLATDGSNTGTIYGHGMSGMRTRRMRRFFEEHGILMGLMVVQPKALYPEGVERKWLRTTKEDYFQREYQFTGDQEVTNAEVQAAHSAPDDTFGYITRYDEYRYSQSKISGEFNSTLDHWNLGRQYSGDQDLDQDWLEELPDKRIFSSSGTDGLLIQTHNSMQVRRALAKNPKPRIF